MSDRDREFDRLEALLKKTVEGLGEHFDSVRIFATRHDAAGDTTAFITRGTGNIFAQQGQIREWLISTEEDARERARRAVE